MATLPILFYFFFCKKNQSFAWKANQWSLVWGNAYLFSSSQWLPHLRLIPLKGFWDDTALFMGHWLASWATLGATEKQEHYEVCGARRGGHSQWQLAQTLIVRLLKNTLFYTYPWLWKVNSLEMSWPDILKPLAVGVQKDHRQWQLPASVVSWLWRRGPHADQVDLRNPTGGCHPGSGSSSSQSVQPVCEFDGPDEPASERSELLAEQSRGKRRRQIHSGGENEHRVLWQQHHCK